MKDIKNAFGKNEHARDPEDESSETSSETAQDGSLSRRALLKGGGVAVAVAGTGGLMTPEAAHAIQSNASSNGERRRREAARVRERAARSYLKGRLPRQLDNGDEGRFFDYRASFFKTLPQNDLGEVDRHAYEDFLKALATGRQRDFNAVPLDPASVRKLANPQGAYAFEMTGLDGQSTRIPRAPKFVSQTMAAEMAEVYWQALTRDVPFRDYGSSAAINNAVSDLNAFSKTVGPKVRGQVTPGTLFRGETPGDLIGPYISQFLWLDVPYGPSTIVQRYDPPVPSDDYGIDYNEWLNIQRGGPSSGNNFAGTPIYIKDNRGLGEYVHTDYLFQAYLNAALIMFRFGPDALSPTNPYKDSANQGAFVTFGPPAIGDLVTKAARVSLTGAWYQKWLVHRRLRPEVFAGRIENQMNGTRKYRVNDQIIHSDAVARLRRANGNSLLPLAFPEGSPTHPSYPAGHATIAGACCTILKAFFNEHYVIPSPVEATADGTGLDPWGGQALTLGNEINKLANNISIGRDAAGVHYRSDGIDGITGGEQQAIGMLQDYSTTYNEHFDGFTFTRFDGTTITIRNGRVRT
ncbi:MAG: vanadium-dependent haloperoxidase [Pseudomonadota bacterium]